MLHFRFVCKKILTKEDGAIVPDSDDSFYKTINSIDFDKLEILKLKTKDGNKDIILKKGDKKIIITIDKLNKIIKYYDEICEYLPDCFLGNSVHVKEIILENVTEIGSLFCYDNVECIEISAPKLRKIKHDFARTYVKKVYLPLLEEVGNSFCEYYDGDKISLPSLKYTGSSFLEYTTGLKSADLPNLEKTGERFLMRNSIESIYLPKIKYLGHNSLRYSRSIKKFDVPSLDKMPSYLEDSQYFLDNLESLVIGSNDARYLINLFKKFPNLKSINGVDIESIFKLALKEQHKLALKGQHKKTKARRLNQ